ncbi:MAG: regulatory protein RecX, partial [Actinobacteria bacterium]|nr:regulatory protein RecX [Actinomycetota bacterium]
PVEPDPDAPGDPESVARIICLRLLDQRARTRAELATALARKGVPAQAAKVVLDRFVELRLIDDAELANSYALARHAQRGQARRAIAAGLRRRGVADEIIAEATAQIGADDERAAARRLVEVKARTMTRLAPEVQQRRLVAMLARRGYSASICHDAVRAVIRTVDDTSGIGLDVGPD